MKEYKPDFFTQLGRIDGIDWRGDTKAVRELGVRFPDDKIKKACQNRLNMMFVNSYRNIEI